MMNKFEYAINFTLPWETGRDKSGNLREDGGYVVDSGGATKWGISSKANPSVDIRALTKEEAIDIYRTKYWDAYNLDVYELGLSVVMFDTGVNCGPGRAKSFLSGTGNSDQAKGVIQQRNIYYLSLDKNKYGQYIKGWLARTNDLSKYVDIIRLETNGS